MDTKYIIAGFGAFGRLALKRLRDSEPDARIVVVDKKPAPDGERALSGTEYICADAVDYLAALGNVAPEDIILPMVPFHLAASYALARTHVTKPFPLPAALLETLPNPFLIDDATIACSLADFLCPDDCPEGETCTVTGMPRDNPLHARLAGLKIPGVHVTVLRSHQLLPGIGGYRFSELLAAVESLRPGRNILATSCRCHGILTGLAL